MRAGMRDAYEKIKARNIEIFKEHAVGLIITNCPACYHMLKYQYRLEEEHGIKVEHITQTLKRKEKSLKDYPVLKEITYHDPCHLGRLS
ncbi:(Fe-S)-binding protein [bacterium]|nr:(Fe-S)-binding protein [bacterium]